MLQLVCVFVPLEHLGVHVPLVSPGTMQTLQDIVKVTSFLVLL